MTDYDPPYTTPEEDPFNVVPARIQPRRKRSSMLDKWINEQQRTHSIRGRNILDLTDDRTPSPAPHADAYFPYPGPAGHLAPHAASRVTVDSYDMVEDEDAVLFGEILVVFVFERSGMNWIGGPSSNHADVAD